MHIETVREALGNGCGSGLIGKLAEGLQQFIGYDPLGGTLSDGSTPIITGGGILPANVAKYQVCNAVLNFVIRFLEGLCEMKASGHDKVSEVIATLRKCVGTGKVPKGFDKLLQKIGEKVEERFDKKIKQSGRTKDAVLNTVFTALKDIIEKSFSSVHQSHKVDDEAQNVQNYLDAVNTKLLDDGSTNFKDLNDKLKMLFGNDTIKPSSSKLSDNEALKIGSLTSDIGNVTTYADKVKSDIGNIKAQDKFKNYANAAVFTAVRDAATAFIAELQTKAYTSFYDKAEWSHVTKQQDQATCAKIFLGCLPLYYQALTYLYWRCHENGGGWNATTLGSGPLKDFLYTMWYDPSKVNVMKRGSDLVTLLEGKFVDLKVKLGTPNTSYPQFLKELHGNAKQKLTGSSTENCPLSALYYCASCYFTCKQAQIAAPNKPPSTIREMLYFLAALPFSLSYEGLIGHIDKVLSTELDVADSGSSQSGNKLSADQIKEYLTTSCSLSPAVLGTLKGGDGPKNSGPWLHELFCNSAFNFKYASGSALFSTISNYAYALQLQLHFLYQQCSNTYTKACGWNQCTFGQKINKSLQSRIVQSHICPVGCTNTSQHTNGNHGQGLCTHDKCGENSNASPLQAFLTDKLKGFSRSHPLDPSSHLATCSGSLCHVPMGFNPNDLRAASNSQLQGVHIVYALGSFCGGFNTPLRQLSEKLGCLTKRTPRTLGDLFGFIWHLNGQLFKSEPDVNNTINDFFTSLGLSKEFDTLKSDPYSAYTSVCDTIAKLPSSNPPKGVQSALKTLFLGLPFWHNLFMVKPDDSLPARLFQLKSTDHKETSQYSGGHNDLYSLYNPNCTTSSNNNCGPYLYPLTHSDGATFGKPPSYASTYLSWVMYLSDDLQSWFQDMLDEFKNMDCKGSGCKGLCNHSAGQHGTSADCSCDSVVQCGGTLPLLYRHGFRYNNPLVLKDGWYYDGQSRAWQTGEQHKRKCSHFASQLKNLLETNSPLDNLLTTIDEFLYLFRFYFFYNQSAFWSIYICLILYTFFFLLDTLRVRSHLHFPSSNSIAPVSLLTTGKAPALTKFTKLTYFIP
ncbi:variant erythrocyte surface antigen-1 family protein [Babesia caballi]|uniref:Variant erythrocyte surface antigen-1 family protein n=1 Tax=Babesia caballi TaxID=5871 RepID=A0AAV4LV62_BABCB|nr:variant erythrocyte surface antigen-1 family protein [Babesia caballi]